jgi:hypothetical protein
MNAQEHVPVEDLAAYAAGDLDAAAGLAVEAHLVLCADCRSDVDAVTNATAALATVERPAMPADVATRIDTVLAAERDLAAVGTVLPMAPKRRRPSFAGIAAVAAGVALLAAISIPFVRDSGSPGKSTDAANAPARAAATRRLASGLDYKRGTLGATLHNALAGITPKEDSGAVGYAGGFLAPTSAVPSPNKAATAPVPVTAPLARDEVALSSLQSDPGKLAACISALAAGLADDAPAAARVPVVVDFATFAGNPAVVVAFPTVSSGAIRDDRLDVFVAGPRCGITPGDDDFLDFERIVRPADL